MDWYTLDAEQREKLRTAWLTAHPDYRKAKEARDEARQLVKSTPPWDENVVTYVNSVLTHGDRMRDQHAAAVKAMDECSKRLLKQYDDAVRQHFHAEK